MVSLEQMKGGRCSIDEKLGEEEGTLKEKSDAMAIRRKYIGQTMWLTTRTRPDIAAC